MRRRRASRSKWAWFCLIFLLPGVILIVVSAVLFRIEWLYHTQAERAVGIVLESRDLGWTRYSTRHNYYVMYEYRPGLGLGIVRESHENIVRSPSNPPRPGDALTVFYLRSRPDYNRLSAGMRLGLPLMLLAVGLPLTVLGGIAEAVVIFDRWRKKR